MEDGVDVVYMDYNATAPMRAEAFEASVGALESVGNASSVHSAGQQAAHRVDLARRRLAGLLNCSPSELVFTSGATEANNLALRTARGGRGAVVTTAVEHPSVLEAARAITADESEALVVLPVDGDGTVDLEASHEVCRAGSVSIISAMLANNETGVLTDLAPIVKVAHEVGALVHTDATQFVGRLPLDLQDLEVDLLSLSAHKFGGPQGIGALFVRRGASVPYEPILVGGGQERGWRAGTLNVAGIAGLGAAAEAARLKLLEEAVRISTLRDGLEKELMSRLSECSVNGARVPRLPGVSSVTFSGAPADAVLAAMPGVAASDGSACSSGALTPSHVLLAMGCSREDTDSTVRFSLGYATTESDVRRAVEATVDAVSHVRSIMREP